MEIKKIARFLSSFNFSSIFLEKRLKYLLSFNPVVIINSPASVAIVLQSTNEEYLAICHGNNIVRITNKQSFPK